MIPALFVLAYLAIVLYIGIFAFRRSRGMTAGRPWVRRASGTDRGVSPGTAGGGSFLNCSGPWVSDPLGQRRPLFAIWWMCYHRATERPVVCRRA